MSRSPKYHELLEPGYVNNTILRNAVSDPTILEFPYTFSSYQHSKQRESPQMSSYPQTFAACCFKCPSHKVEGFKRRISEHEEWLPLHNLKCATWLYLTSGTQKSAVKGKMSDSHITVYSNHRNYHRKEWIDSSTSVEHNIKLCIPQYPSSLLISPRDVLLSEILHSRYMALYITKDWTANEINPWNPSGYCI
jgi:hypothetical protein